MASAGVLAGLLASFWAGRVLAGQLYRVPPSDLLAFTAASALLLAVSALAALGPAWRAARRDPIAALRHD
jgi:ABC-type antimicrobial peptide transport system permease subunit